MIRAMKDAPGRPDRPPHGEAGARPDLPLEPDRETLARWFDQTRDELVRFVADIPTAPSKGCVWRRGLDSAYRFSSR